MMITTRCIPLLLLMCAPVLAGCATVIEGSTQQISFKTVGADDAYCDIQIGIKDYRYAVRPPQTVWIQKSSQPMFISCSAPGNRVQNMTIDSHVAGTTALNGLAAGMTLPADAVSGAMYKYPDEVVIDFTGVVTQQNPLPSYENEGAYHPKNSDIEYMGPDVPALPDDDVNAERTKRAYEAYDRDQQAEKDREVERQRRIDAVEGGFFGDKSIDKHKGKAAIGPTAPVAKVTQSSDVELTPLPDAVPAAVGAGAAGIRGESNTGADRAVDPKSLEITPLPPANHPKLGKPIFPSSTSF